MPLPAAAGRRDRLGQLLVATQAQVAAFVERGGAGFRSIRSRSPPATTSSPTALAWADRHARSTIRCCSLPPPRRASCAACRRSSAPAKRAHSSSRRCRGSRAAWSSAASASSSSPAARPRAPWFRRSRSSDAIGAQIDPGVPWTARPRPSAAASCFTWPEVGQLRRRQTSSRAPSRASLRHERALARGDLPRRRARCMRAATCTRAPATSARASNAAFSSRRPMPASARSTRRGSPRSMRTAGTRRRPSFEDAGPAPRDLRRRSAGALHHPHPLDPSGRAHAGGRLERGRRAAADHALLRDEGGSRAARALPAARRSGHRRDRRSPIEARRAAGLPLRAVLLDRAGAERLARHAGRSERAARGARGDRAPVAHDNRPAPLAPAQIDELRAHFGARW